MSAHVLLKLLNELGEAIKCEACGAFYHFLAKSLKRPSLRLWTFFRFFLFSF